MSIPRITSGFGYTMIYLLDSSFEEWDLLTEVSRPIADADMCYISDSGVDGLIASVRGDGLLIYYADRGVLRLNPHRDRWLANLATVDPEDRFLLAMQSAQMDAFQRLMEHVSQITGAAVGEHLWDVPAAIQLLERHGSVLASYLRMCHPFPFVELGDIGIRPFINIEIWPFVRLVGNNMQAIHIYK